MFFFQLNYAISERRNRLWQFHQLQIGEKNFHLSHVLFELSDLEATVTEKSQRIK